MLSLLADGGSTKTQWLIRETGRSLFTAGMNPAVMPPDQLCATLRELRTQLPANQPIGAVEYYGAGCRGEASDRMAQAIREVLLPQGTVTVESDMLGAARITLGNRPGIVCILGTGSNSCLYNGDTIIANTPPMGYILGDEGSGAWLGKRLLADHFKGLLPATLSTALTQEYPHLTYSTLLDHVYRPTSTSESSPTPPLPPNRFLASFAPFLSRHISHPAIEAIVAEGFDLFYHRNLAPYYTTDASSAPSLPSPHTLPHIFVGSVAFAFAPQLRALATRHNLPTPLIFRSPLPS